MPGRSTWLIVLFKFCIPLLIFCQVVLPIIKNGVLIFLILFLNCIFLPSVLSVFASYILGLCC